MLKRHSKFCALLSASVVLASCTTTILPNPDASVIPAPAQGVASSPAVLGTDHFTLGDYSSSAWVSDSFSGHHARQIQAEALHYAIEQVTEDGGVDIGLSRTDYDPVDVEEAKSGLTVCSTYRTELAGDGRWWAGPKVSVNWQGEEAAKGNGDDWYENYIIEIASSTPDELHAIFTDDYFKAEVLQSTKLAGATYRHYKIRFHSWWQFWSVRQDYRETGTLPLEPILDVWIANGLPTGRVFDGVKANIETYGPVRGTGAMRIEMTTDPGAELTCD
jgi:hypothetical protein